MSSQFFLIILCFYNHNASFMIKLSFLFHFLHNFMNFFDEVVYFVGNDDLIIYVMMLKMKLKLKFHTFYEILMKYPLPS